MPACWPYCQILSGESQKLSHPKPGSNARCQIRQILCLITHAVRVGRLGGLCWERKRRFHIDEDRGQPLGFIEAIKSAKSLQVEFTAQNNVGKATDQEASPLGKVRTIAVRKVQNAIRAERTKRRQLSESRILKVKRARREHNQKNSKLPESSEVETELFERALKRRPHNENK